MHGWRLRVTVSTSHLEVLLFVFIHVVHVAFCFYSSFRCQRLEYIRQVKFLIFFTLQNNQMVV